MMKRITVFAALLCLVAGTLYSATKLQRGGTFVIKPGDATEDQSFVMADYADNTDCAYFGD